MAAALTLGMRGHNVTVFEAAPKVLLSSQERKTFIDILALAHGGWSRNPSIS